MSNEKEIELENFSKSENKQSAIDEKTIDVKQNKDGQKKSLNKDIEHNQTKIIYLKIILYLFLIFCNIILVYVIKPVSVFLELMFLSDIIKIAPKDDFTSYTLGESITAIGYLIIFILPIYNFVSRAIPIIVIQDNLISQIFAFFYTIIEITFNIPLTFMYDSYLYSIFLYGEKGIKQTLSPWLVFFPTQYTTSIFEIIRNFVEPFFFLGIGFVKLEELKQNKYQSYRYIILLILILFCIMRIIGNVANIIVRFLYKDDKTNKLN
jgi:hypothetical protein